MHPPALPVVPTCVKGIPTLANTGAVRETLQSLGCSALTDADIEDWAALIDRDREPLLIRAGRAARDWMNRLVTAPNDPGGMFLAACLWRAKGAPRPIPLPFWSAPEIHHNRLDLHAGLPWMADFLACSAAAAKIGLDELERLQRAEEKSRSLGRTARSHLIAATDAVLRVPVVTTRELAETLKITPRAALELLRQLADAGVIRETTGRTSWRAFALV